VQGDLQAPGPDRDQPANLWASFKITNVRVFDGQRFGKLQSVSVADGKIVAELNDAVEVDGAGGYLLPASIDAHIHLHSTENLTQLCKWGATTGLDMVCFPPIKLASLPNHRGVTNIRSA
jgi:cytosine/adenosine deaminase-related metal-dependent hydrolase